MINMVFHSRCFDFYTIEYNEFIYCIYTKLIVNTIFLLLDEIIYVKHMLFVFVIRDLVGVGIIV